MNDRAKRLKEIEAEQAKLRAEAAELSKRTPLVGTARRDMILGVVDDLVSDFLYYDRKEDEELPRESIEAAIEAGEITVDRIVDAFRKSLEDAL